jgi:hypothetical protein
MIEKLRNKHYDSNNIVFGLCDDIKYLFKSLTTKRTVIINLNRCGYDGDDLFFFDTGENDIKAAQRKLNCTIKILSNKVCVTTAVQIKFNHPRLRNPLTAIEVLEIFQLLSISYESMCGDVSYCILSSVYCKPKTRQTSMIELDFCYAE